MDVKERKAFQECYKTSRDYKFYVRHEMSEKQIFEFKKGKYVVDCVNDGWEIWQAAKTQAVSQEKGRSDFEIISQTIELVDLLASANRFQRDKSRPFPFDSNNPRNIEWWRLACKIQELLTNTDPNNCDFDEYKAMIEAAQEVNNE